MKGSRKSVGGFRVGEEVEVGSKVAVIESFLSRRAALILTKDGDRKEVSTLKLKKIGD